MALNEYYQEITQLEADFLIDLYQSISKLIREGRDITLVGVAHDMGVKTKELYDYLPQIVTILDKVEQEYKVQQGRD